VKEKKVKNNWDILLMKSLLIVLFQLLIVSLFAQEYTCISVNKTNEQIKIDGLLNESVWKNCDVTTSFWQNFPYDTSEAKSKTEVMITYDEHMIYVAAICYDSIPGKNIIQTLKRDFPYSTSDVFVVTIDPFSDKQNGFSFGVNPYGVQREGLVANGGGEAEIAVTWDNKWFAEVKRNEFSWIAEIAIPFKSIRYKNNNKDWRINFYRNDLKRNESSSWNKVPRQFNVTSLAYTGVLHFDTLLKKSGPNISVIPYLTGGLSKDALLNNNINNTYNAGGDAKIGVSSSLNLDITINPDFSQVEVDRQQTNLTRFSLFFPEQRQFFIENSDLFQSFGFRQIRPFFSRRIGLNNGNIIPIVSGFRLSGKPTNQWRIGLMDLQTADTKINNENIFSQNYFVAAVQRNVFSRSNIAAIFVNRQQFDSTGLSGVNFNRVAGLDYNLATADNKWTGKFFFHHSFSQTKNAGAFTHASWLRYSNQHWSIHWNHEYVNKNYSAETGFTPRIFQYNTLKGEQVRNSYWRLEPFATHNFFPSGNKINRLSTNLYADYYANEKYQTTDYLIQLSERILFKNTSFIYVMAQQNYTKLLYQTDVTFSGKNNFLESGDYYYNDASINFKSDQRKLFIIGGTIQYGTYYTGKKLSYNAEIIYRWQPYGIFSVSYNRDQIELPGLKEAVGLDLLGTKIELTFTKKLFLTTFLQYNSQLNNFNINTRLQYRFKPMSDFFIVYSDNYLSTNFQNKNKAIVFKFVYWFNL
jgi:hypothetical protein